jgi:hypothetical protein
MGEGTGRLILICFVRDYERGSQRKQRTLYSPDTRLSTSVCAKTSPGLESAYLVIEERPLCSPKVSRCHRR